MNIYSPLIIQDNIVVGLEKDSLSITIPKEIIGIADKAFKGILSLKEVNILGDLNSIGNEAFMDCINLEVLNILGNIESIGEKAFCNCESLKEINFPKNLKNIGALALMGCSSIKKLSIPYVFNGTMGYLFGTKENDVRFYPANQTVFGASKNKYYFPKSLKEINVLGDALHKYAFENMYEIEKVSLDDIKTISYGAFINCVKLNSISLVGVTNIMNYAFYGCESLKEVKIPYTVDTIASYVFSCHMDIYLENKDTKGFDPLWLSGSKEIKIH